MSRRFDHDIWRIGVSMHSVVKFWAFERSGHMELGSNRYVRKLRVWAKRSSKLVARGSGVITSRALFDIDWLNAVELGGEEKVMCVRRGASIPLNVPPKK